MEEQLISLETAILAKEKGFNQNPYVALENHSRAYLPRYTDGSDIYLGYPLFSPENNVAIAPTQSLLCKYLRDNHKIHVFIDREEDYWIFKYCEFSKGNKTRSGRIQYVKPEEAIEAGLYEVLDQLIK